MTFVLFARARSRPLAAVVRASGPAIWRSTVRWKLDGLERPCGGGAGGRGELVDRAVVGVERRGRGAVVVAERGLDRLPEPRLGAGELRVDPGAARPRAAPATRGRAADSYSGPPARDAANTEDADHQPGEDRGRERGAEAAHAPAGERPAAATSRRAGARRLVRGVGRERRVGIEMASPGRLHDGRAGAPQPGSGWVPA